MNTRTLANKLRAGAQLLDMFPSWWVKSSVGGANRFCAIGAVGAAEAGFPYSGRYPSWYEICKPEPRIGRAVAAWLRARGHTDDYACNIDGLNDGYCNSAKEASRMLRQIARIIEHGGKIVK